MKTEMKEKILGDYGRTVPQRIPLTLFEQIEEFEAEHKYRTRTDAINALLEIGLIVVRHKDVLKDDHLKQEILDQLREGGLVDYFQKLSNKDLTILDSIVKNEVASRK